jgi:hypothetical protein
VTNASPATVALAPQITQIKPGDVLVTYDRLPALLAVAALVPFSDGANAWGATTRAIQLLTFRSQVSTPVPPRDSVVMTLQRPDGTRYDVELPWLSAVRAVCSAGVPGTPSAAAGGESGLGVNPYQIEYEENYQLSKRLNGGLALTPSAEPILSFAKTTNASGTFGYIVLQSFSPAVLTVDQTVDEVARILRDELRDTDGLIIDVRNNGGGQILLAETLPQLFGPNPIQVEGFRLLNSDGNATILGTPAYKDSNWHKLIDEVHGTSAHFTRTAQFTSDATANQRTQVYFKPVAVLTNARCFSSCDMFTAAMQDNGSARIWGEDVKTGAGGANVVTDAYLRSLLPAGPANLFPPLPGGQSMRVAWRQTVRAGKNAGRLIEDYGVTRDASAVKTNDDVLHASQSQVARITRDLGARAPKSRGSIYLQQTGTTDIPAGESIALTATVADTDSVEYVLDGQVASRVTVGIGPAQLVRLDSGVHPTEARLFDVELRGYRGGTRVWRAFANARSQLPYLPLPAGGLRLDFDDGNTAPLALYARGKDAGWIVRDGTLTTTRGATYADLTFSDAVLFVDAGERSSLQLSLHARISTELDYDYFTIYAIVDGKRTVLEQFSGDIGERALSYDLSAFAGHQVQIGFQLTSDGFVNASGVYLDEIALQ